MGVLQNKWLMVFCNLAAVTLFFFLWAPAYDLFNFINQLFYIAYFYLFIGILLWVIRGGFFDGVTYSFRRFSNRMAKNKDYLDDWQEKPLPSQTIQHTWLKFFMFHGVALMVGLLGLLALYYNS